MAKYRHEYFRQTFSLRDNHLRPAVLEAMQADRTMPNKPATAEAAICILAICDPSAEEKDKPGRYLNWLCRTYATEWEKAKTAPHYTRFQHPMLAEDFSRIHDYLSDFDQKKHKLPAGQRDIGRLSFSDLKDTVISLREKSQDIPVSDDLLAQSTILYNGPEGLIVVPHSTASSCAWGRGTEWCTAATKAVNHFQNYNRNGPLIFLRTAAGEKFQTHAHSELMDVRDEQVTTHSDSLRKLLDAIPHRLKRTLKENCRSPIYGSDVKIDDEMSDIIAFDQILDENYDWSDPDSVRKAVAVNYKYFENAHKDLRADRGFVLEMIKMNHFNGPVIYYASEELRTDRELALEAIRCDAHSHHIDGALLYQILSDRETVLEGLEQNWHAIWSMRRLNPLPDFHADHTFWLEAAQRNGDVINFLPLKYQNEFTRCIDRELVLAAVRQKGSTLQHASSDLTSNREIVLTAVRQDADAFGYSSGKLDKDPQFIEDALRENVAILKYIPASRIAELPLSLLQDSFKKSFANDWRVIGYASDVQIELTPQDELQTFERGLADKTRPLRQQQLHLFPSLRDNTAFLTLSIEEAHNKLKTLAAPQRNIATDNPVFKTPAIN